MKRIFVLLLTVVLVFPAASCVKSEEGQHDGSSSIVYKKVDPSPQEGRSMSGSNLVFDMHKQITEPDCIFKGRIVSSQIYEVSWTDREGEKNGPRLDTVLSVQILAVYLGRPPGDNNLLRIYFPLSIDMPFSETFPLRDGREYVFFAKSFGEQSLTEDLVGTPWHKSEMETRADMYIGNSLHSSLPIEAGMIVANSEYDFAGRAISLAEPGSASRLAPLSTEYFAKGDFPLPTFSLYNEDYFVAALQHYAQLEGVVLP